MGYCFVKHKISYPRYFVPTVKGGWGNKSEDCYCVRVDKPGAKSIFMRYSGEESLDSGYWNESICDNKVKTEEPLCGESSAIMKEVTAAEFVLMELGTPQPRAGIDK